MNEERFSVPCDSRCVDGLLRGAMIGFAWSLYVPITTNGSSTELTWFRKALTRVTGSCKVAGLFGSFFGVLNGFTCLSERLRGQQDHYNALIGGCITGSLASLPSKNPRLILGTGLACGFVGSAISSFADTFPSNSLLDHQLPRNF